MDEATLTAQSFFSRQESYSDLKKFTPDVNGKKSHQDRKEFMEKMWFSSFAEASEWTRAQGCGFIRRSCDANGFDWLLPDEEKEKALPFRIDVERLSTFVSYSFNGMTIKCKNLFLKELGKWSPVSENAQKVIVEADKTLVWTDLSSGLSWDVALVFQDPHGTSPIGLEDVLNEFSYGGFSDWRQPTIHELSTLLSEQETGPGIYIKRPLLRSLPSKSWGRSRYESDDSAYFDFETRLSGTQRYNERDRYYSGGEYEVSNVASRSVRGQLTVSQSSWINTIARWAARNNSRGIPLNENGILFLQELNLNPDIVGSVSELPNEFLQLEHVRSITIGGVLREIPALVFKFKKLEELNIKSYSCNEIPEMIADLNGLQVLKVGEQVKKLPENIVALEALKQLVLPPWSTFQLTPAQTVWVQRLNKRGCVVVPSRHVDT